jgi:hypothetical protein
VAGEDVTPAWGEWLPEWAHKVIPLLSGGGYWPLGSESLQRQLSDLYVECQGVLTEAADEGAGAYNVIRSGWDAPPALVLDEISDNLFTGFDSQVMCLADNAFAYASEARAFALETEYTKLSINMAFYVTMMALFFTALATWWAGGAPAVLRCGGQNPARPDHRHDSQAGPDLGR